MNEHFRFPRVKRGRWIFAPVLAVALLASLIGAAAIASADANEVALVNGGFESGDTSGWQVQVECTSDCDTDSVEVVQSYEGNTETLTAPDGNYFAILRGACPDSTLSQQFTAEAGQVLFGNAFFSVNEAAGDEFEYDDYGRVEVMQGNTVVATLFDKDAISVGGETNTPWTPLSYTIPSTGTYTLVATSGNGEDCSVDSVLGIDFPSNIGPVTAAPATQLWGHSVTLTSASGGFTGTTSVLMNGQPTPFMVTSDSTIVARVPEAAGIGSVNVAIITPSGGVVVPNAFMAFAPVVVTLPTPPATSTPSPTTTSTPTSTPTSTTTATPTPVSECPSPPIELSGAATLTTWAGSDGAPIAAAVTDCGLDGVTAIWTFDSGAQAWQGWFANSGGTPGANDITTFSTGTAYFFLTALAS
jgi:hypothetical protein